MSMMINTAKSCATMLAHVPTNVFCVPARMTLMILSERDREGDQRREKERERELGRGVGGGVVGELGRE